MKKFLSILILSLFVTACQNQPVSDQNQTQDRQQIQDSSETFSGKITDLLKLGKDLKCTWDTTDQGVDVSGTAYISGQKSRTEMKINQPEMTVTSYFVSDGDTAYMWGDNQPGFKMNLADFEDQSDDTSSDSAPAENNWNQDFDYNCSAWAVDPSVFQIPTDIEFTDMGQMVEDMQGGLGDMCNSLPEPQKTECLNSLE